MTQWAKTRDSSWGPLFDHPPTQEDRVLERLKRGDLTMVEAQGEMFIHRLSERIRRLKLRGWLIENVQAEYKTVYAVYRLMSPEPQKVEG